VSEKQCVVVAEDSPRDREFLAHSLADSFRLVVATNGVEAMRLAIEHTDDALIISDLQMPEMNGIDMARRLWKQRPNSKILFWSHHKDEMYVRALAKIIPAETVYGYVLKDNTAVALNRAAHAVFIEGQCWLDSKVRSVQARMRNQSDAITDFEYEVLIDIALGLTDNMIAQRHYLSRRGVQNRLQSLYSKLGADQESFNGPHAGEALNSRARAITLALQRGLITPFQLEHEEQKFREWLARKSQVPGIQ